MKAWVLISTDERMVMSVAATAELAQADAERDACEPLTWRPGRNGRFVNDKWDYEVRPFEVIE